MASPALPVFKPRPLRPPAVEEVLREVSEGSGVAVADIIHGSRAARIVDARAQACRRLADQGFSYKSIGRLLCLHRTSVWYLLRKRVRIPF